MCGIAGFIDFTNSSSRKVIEGMTASMEHRGPDGMGHEFYQFPKWQAGLGHRRLSIIDLSESASQPMEFDDLCITFNGEIYNYQEIKDELVLLGHGFKTLSDTEVILHAWRQWGEDCLIKMRGMFAMVLYDLRLQKLTCIRDRAGAKPFYYYQTKELFIWGSELKAILAHPAFIKEIDPNAVASFLQYGYISHPHAIFKKTYKLSAGSLLTLNLPDRTTAIYQYWNVYDQYDRPKLSIPLPEAITKTENILQKAFQYRMVADVPVGVFLSGGYDSTCVTALLQKDSAEKIKTFTIGSTDSKLDEAPYAKQIAKMLGTDHTEHYCTAKEALDIIPDLPYYYDEPFADSSAIPTILVSRMARKQVTVALSADAGDEIFAGYNRYDYISRFGKKIKMLPSPVRKTIAAAMNAIPSERIPYFRHAYNFHGRYHKLKNILRDPSTSELLKNLSQAFTSLEVANLFNCAIVPLKTSHSIIKPQYDDLAYMMAVDYDTYMVDDILQKVDRATMSASLEGREPFLDQEIIEWAAQLPSDYKYHNGEKKYILKQIVHKYIPKEIMERPKMGFGIPVEKWLQNELKDLVYDFLNPGKLKEHGLFNADRVKAILDEFYSGRTERHLQVWYLLMFQMWYNRWFCS